MAGKSSEGHRGAPGWSLGRAGLIALTAKEEKSDDTDKSTVFHLPSSPRQEEHTATMREPVQRLPWTSAMWVLKWALIYIFY